MTEIRTAHIRIEGRVQGVGYRAWTERLACSLGLLGWVRNRRDGAVEAVFQGSAENVAEMLQLCQEGPNGACVDRVMVIGDGVGVFDRFDVRPTE